MNEHAKNSELEAAIAEYGLSTLAVGVGVSPQALNNWRDRGVTAEGAVAIEQFSGAKFVCERLRPSERWERVKDKAWPHPGGRPLRDLAANVKAEAR